MPEVGLSSPRKVKGSRPNEVSIRMVPSSDREEMLLSGARATPNRTVQRLRARIWARNRLTFATTGAGGLPASTRSKCRRANVSSPLRKKARASSRRTRTRSGLCVSILRSRSMAARRWRSLVFSDRPGRDAARISIRARLNAASAVMAGRACAPAGAAVETSRKTTARPRAIRSARRMDFRSKKRPGDRSRRAVVPDRKRLVTACVRRTRPHSCGSPRRRPCPWCRSRRRCRRRSREPHGFR